MKWLAAGLAAIALLAIVLALRERSSSTSNAASPASDRGVPTMSVPGIGPGTEHAGGGAGDPGDHGGPGDHAGGGDPSGDEHGADQAQPMVVDQYGNPVDEETARQILEQMEEDAREAYENPGRGRGRGKKKFKGN